MVLSNQLKGISITKDECENTAICTLFKRIQQSLALSKEINEIQLPMMIYWNSDELRKCDPNKEKNWSPESNLEMAEIMELAEKNLKRDTHTIYTYISMHIHTHKDLRETTNIIKK